MTLPKLYHGTRERAWIDFRRKSSEYSERAGIYLSADKRYADSYGTGATITATATLRNPYRITLPENWSFSGPVILGDKMITGTYRNLTTKNIAEMEAAGYDGIVVEVVGSLLHGPWATNPINPFEVVVFDPDNITTLDCQTAPAPKFGQSFKNH